MKSISFSIFVSVLSLCALTFAQARTPAQLPDEVILRDLPPGTFMVVKEVPRLDQSHVDYVSMKSLRGSSFDGYCRILDSDVNQRFEFTIGRRIVFSHSTYKVYPEEPLRDRVIVWKARLTGADNGETTEMDCASKVEHGDLYARDLKRLFYGSSFFQEIR